MHLRSITINELKYPTYDYYPFNLPVFQKTKRITLNAPVTFFAGENGSGKSTLLQALSRSCGIHIWQETERTSYNNNPYQNRFCDSLTIEWSNGKVTGLLLRFRHLSSLYRNPRRMGSGGSQRSFIFGGKSLITQSHGESLMSFFRSRYQIKGLYLLDEPETALSPRSQLVLLELLTQTSAMDHAQFIIATHSPILLACPHALIYSFDHSPARQVLYEETEHYKIYRAFLENRTNYLK